MNSNSNEYWEYRFQNDWAQAGGNGQTLAFGQMLLDHLPSWLVSDIRVRKLSICDAGCADGEATALFKQHFPACEVSGFDFSESAVETAGKAHPECRFFRDDIRSFSQCFDVIFISNVLEHFSEPREVLRHLTAQSVHHTVVLVPYLQLVHGGEHESAFDLNAFPMFVDEKCISYAEIIDASTVPEALWNGQQLLVVYSDREYMRSQNFNAADLFWNHRSGYVREEAYNELSEQYKELIHTNQSHYDELRTLKDVLAFVREENQQLISRQSEMAVRMQQTTAEQLAETARQRERENAALRAELEKDFSRKLADEQEQLRTQARTQLERSEETIADCQRKINALTQESSNLQRENNDLKQSLHERVERDNVFNQITVAAGDLIPTAENAIEQVERRRVRRLLRASGVGSAFLHAGLKEKFRIIVACFARLFGIKIEIRHQEVSPYYLLRDQLQKITAFLYRTSRTPLLSASQFPETQNDQDTMPSVFGPFRERDDETVDPLRKNSHAGGKKRIAYLTNMVVDWNDGRPRYGGGERYLLNLSRLLEEYGYEIHVYQPAYFEGETEYYGLKVKLMKAGPGYSEFSISNADAFYDISLDYDHVIYNLPEYSAMRMRKDALMMCHGIWFDHNNYGASAKFRQPEWMHFLYRAFNSPLRIISVDTNSINVIRSFFPELSGKMTFIPNFADTSVFFPPSEPRNNAKLKILFPRRSQVNRGSRILGGILRLIPEDVEFYWVGEGDAEDTDLILDLAKKDPRLHYEHSDFDSMPDWYRMADIAVIPTIACEGTSLSCIEAMACGCATVATNVGGLPDVIYNEINGLCVDPTPAALAGAINRLIRDEALRCRLQKDGAVYAQRLSLDSWKEKWREVLEQLKWIDSTHRQQRVCILTRNAIHGGVESLICLEQKALDADVIVTGGAKDELGTCPFDYRYVTTYKQLLSELVAYDVVIYHWIPDWAVQAVDVSGVFSMEFVHRTDTAESDKSVPDLILSHSQYVLDRIADTTGRTEGLCIVPNGTDITRFHPAEHREKNRVIGAVTSYYGTKGIDILIRAWQMVDKNKKNGYTLELWGAGSELESFCAMIGPEDGIDLHGPTREPQEIYGKLALYVTASRIEGLPVSVLEAMASDLPVIASDIEGHRIINEIAAENGFPPPLRLFPGENPKALAGMIEEFLTDPWRAETRKLTGELFSGEKHCEKLKELIEEHWLRTADRAEAASAMEQEERQ